LLFWNYIEGSSNNKALEISNATGVAVNLIHLQHQKKKQSLMALGVLDLELTYLEP
jgi:hypothetical protein